MVPKIHFSDVIWGAFFPPPVNFFFQQKSAECSVCLYSSPWLGLDLVHARTISIKKKPSQEITVAMEIGS